MSQMDKSAHGLLAQVWFSGGVQSPPAASDGLKTLRMALIAIEAGLPLDAATGQHLSTAFRDYLYEGKSDLTANLGLRSGRGRKCEAPLRLEALKARDDLIKDALSALGGNTPENRMLLSGMLAADDLVLPDCFGFADSVMRIRKESGGRLQISDRQLARIARGDSAYQKRA